MVCNNWGGGPKKMVDRERMLITNKNSRDVCLLLTVNLTNNRVVESMEKSNADICFVLFIS